MKHLPEVLPVPVAHEQRLTLTLERSNILPTLPDLDRPITASLVARHTDLERRAREHQLPVRFGGYHPVFTGHQVVLLPDAPTDWVVMNITQDPVFTSSRKSTRKGTLYVPDKVLAEVQRALRAGIDFDSIFIAHEVEKGSVSPHSALDLHTLMPQRPGALAQKHEFRQRTVSSFWRGIGRAVSGMFTAPVTAAAALSQPDLDPVLFGVNYDSRFSHNEQAVGMWYYITHWYW